MKSSRFLATAVCIRWDFIWGETRSVVAWGKQVGRLRALRDAVDRQQHLRPDLREPVDHTPSPEIR